MNVVLYVLAAIGAVAVSVFVAIVGFIGYVWRDVEQQKCSCGKYYPNEVVRDKWGGPHQKGVSAVAGDRP